MGSKVIRRIIALRLGTWLHCHILINYLMLQQQKNLIQCVIDSYLDKGIDPLSRIEKIWYATFFLRYWRQWILQHSNYTVQNNFITQNAYLCIELNAHAIVCLLILICVIILRKTEYIYHGYWALNHVKRHSAWHGV